MLFKTTEVKYQPNPTIERAVEVLFILHADHEQNCSTNAVRSVGSSQVDPYSALAAAWPRSMARCTAAPTRKCSACSARSAPRTAFPRSSEQVKEGKAKLMGFGHRVYKNYDPRAKIIKRMADQVFAVTKPSPLLPIALELERIALEDEYFVSRNLYPNVDFYSGLIYEALGFPVDDVPGALRDPAHERLARPVAGDARGRGADA